MVKLGKQILALSVINIRGLQERGWATASSVVAVSLVTLVLLGLLAMGSGFKQTLESAGKEDVAILLRAGSTSEISSAISPDQIAAIQNAPQIVGPNGRKQMSGELYVVVEGYRKGSEYGSNLTLRGVGPQAFIIRDDIAILSGRKPTPGSNEVIVGKSVSDGFAGLEQGDDLKLGREKWKVVGIFGSNGSVVESEIWGDIGSVQSQFNRPNIVQSVRGKLKSADQLSALQKFIKDTPNLNLEAQSEKSFFQAQSKNTSDLIFYLAWPLGIVMSIGVLAAVLNTMYHSISKRSSEIATLRSIGFGSFATFFAIVAESLFLTFLGFALGLALAFVLINGYSASTLSSNFTQVIFDFAIDWESVIQALILLLFVGVLGGSIPGYRVSYSPITEI